ncbi:hypothetical protein G7046_g9629 [Stylonectria norvegica]|nr:hypothetical protein G7046_g9629 [Stylonectria norvegica]
MNDYRPGQTLTLETGSGSVLQVRIINLHLPWTMSVVMQVEIPPSPHDLPNSPQIAFLKLYDRRFANQLRRQFGLGPWSPALEARLVAFSRSGASKEFLGQIWNDWELEPGEILEDHQWEAVLTVPLAKMFRAELMAYSALERYQGGMIPRVYHSVTRRISPTDGYGRGSSPELFEIDGFLLENIYGVSLSRLAFSDIPRRHWHYIAERAVETTNELLARNRVLNQDVRPDNMMVCPDEAYMGGYRLVMLDFGLARLQGPNETWEQWVRAKYEADEEGSMGTMLRQGLLHDAGFRFDYRPSNVWRR